MRSVPPKPAAAIPRCLMQQNTDWPCELAAIAKHKFYLVRVELDGVEGLRRRVDSARTIVV